MLISICVLLFLAQVYGVIASLASGVDAGNEQGIVSVAAVACFGGSTTLTNRRSLRLRSVTGVLSDRNWLNKKSPAFGTGDYEL